MKTYIIKYILFENFKSNIIFQFDKEPTKNECKFWLWNIINKYEKNTLDWELTINDIEIIKIKEINENI